MVVFGESSPQFSWIEYQALMLCLAGLICTSLFFVEIALNRFQVLPLLFPGMFVVKERRFYFFNFDISDGVIGKKIRAEAKMVCRMTICLVLSYLWQHCVLETTQQVGQDFPREECDKGADCFASNLHFVTFFNRQYEAIDCKSEENFKKRVVVSCIRFIPPTATTWLMHLAISHSVTQLNFKAFEILVWVSGNSKWARRLIVSLIFVSLSTFVSLFFAGVITEFVSSWLAFVMSLMIPWFLYTVYKSAKQLERLWKMDAHKVQRDLELHLNIAFLDIEYAANLDAQHSVSQNDGDSKKDSGRKAEPGAMNVMSHTLSRFTKFVKRKSTISQKAFASSAGQQEAPNVEIPEADPLSPKPGGEDVSMSTGWDIVASLPSYHAPKKGHKSTDEGAVRKTRKPKSDVPSEPPDAAAGPN